MSRFVYGTIAILFWLLFILCVLGEGVYTLLSMDVVFLSFAIVAAGAMAGGK